MLFHGSEHFALRFMEVNLDGDIQFRRQGGYFLQVGFRHGVRRVGSKSNSNQLLMFEIIAQAQALTNVFISISSPGGGEVQDWENDLAANTSTDCSFCAGVREKIHIAERGGATAQHFCNSQFGTVANEAMRLHASLPLARCVVPARALAAGRRRNRAAGSWRHGRAD